MRKTDNPEGEIFVFETEEEREDYFTRGEKAINESQEKSLLEARKAYMSLTVQARNARGQAGRQKAKHVSEEINRGYMEQVKKIYELYAGARARLRTAQDGSLLESDLEPMK